MAVINCWQCGNPFALERVHKETGHVILTCSNCTAPFDLGDTTGLEILESYDTLEAQDYVREWRNALFLKSK